MNKTYFPFSLFLFLISLTFVSCKKEKTTKELLIGKWDVFFEKYTRYQNNVITSDDSYSNPPGDFVLEFFADGTGKFYEKTVVSTTFTWEIIVEGKLIVTYSSLLPLEVEITVNKSSLIWKMTSAADLNGIEYKIVDYKECNRI